MKENKCDCFIGNLCGEDIHKSTFDAEVEGVVRSQINCKKYGLLDGEPQNKKQIVDGKKGYLSRFTYCPYCGYRLDWKDIIKM